MNDKYRDILIEICDTLARCGFTLNDSADSGYIKAEEDFVRMVVEKHRTKTEKL